MQEDRVGSHDIINEIRDHCANRRELTESRAGACRVGVFGGVRVAGQWGGGVADCAGMVCAAA